MNKGDASVDQLLDIFDKTQIAELASYAQIAAERIRVIQELKDIIDNELSESEFQSLLAKASWLVEPSWTVITQNQSLKTFKSYFELFWKKKYKEVIILAISYEDKRPDFTLVSIDGLLHVVEIKKSSHKFDDSDCERMLNYVDAFDEFFDNHRELAKNFPRGWKIDLIADGENIKSNGNKIALKSLKDSGKVTRITWIDFLDRIVSRDVV